METPVPGGEHTAADPAATTGPSGVGSAGSGTVADFSIDPGPGRPRAANRPLPAVPGYDVEAELGRGGMGVVYKARQQLLNRPCALKMILAGAHATPEVVVRFLGEAEAVARLQHPGIVQVYHVAEHDGCPFFEMEYVPGGSLASQLDGTPRPPRAAAVLVESLARAVAEAHRLGIVHRDLKPANVLMTAVGAPKVTDFGLAKSLGSDAGLTRTESVLGTPSYMAPEQAEGHARKVGPAADVYSLGAILYELLIGRPPFKGATVLETLEQVKNAEVVPPSRLVPGIPRDVETIALKCLRKDPWKRYETADALADDLRRFLDGRPILARRTGPIGRSWRWCRRNPQVAALLLTIGLLLAVGAGVGGFAADHFRRLAKRADLARNDERLARIRADQLFAMANIARTNEEASRKDADRKAAEAQAARKDAERKAAEARATVDFFVDDMLGAARPENKRRGSPTVDDVLGAADRAIAGRFGGEPLLEATIRHTLAETYRSLAQLPRAQAHAERAVALREEHLGKDDPETLRSTLLLARIVHRQETQPAEARRLAERVLEARRRTLGPDHPETVEALAFFGHTINNLPARRAEARESFERGLTAQRKLYGPDDARTFETLEGLAWTLQGQGKLRESLAAWDELLERRRRVRGPDHYEVARTLELRALTLSNSRPTEQTAADYEEALRIYLKLPDPGFMQVYWLTDRLFGVWTIQSSRLRARGQVREGREAIRKALAVCDRWVERAGAFRARDPAHTPARDELIHALSHRAGLLATMGRLDDAGKDCDRVRELDAANDANPTDATTAFSNLALACIVTARAEQAVAVSRQGLGLAKAAGSTDAANTFTLFLALALDAAGRPAEAAPLHREIVARHRAVGATDPITMASFLAFAGENAIARREFAEAERLLREALDLRETRHADDFGTANARSLLGVCLAGLGKDAEAEPLLLAGYEGVKARAAAIPTQVRDRVAEAGARVVAFYESKGDAEKAAAWRAKLGLPAKTSAP